mmetsp:Transcript_44041/g.139790  ORF Transcript_44041/g.139790 Transcript_44041/m.139790 type:complete len:317 (+) Transcript_44041:491-1441(+)
MQPKVESQHDEYSPQDPAPLQHRCKEQFGEGLREATGHLVLLAAVRTLQRLRSDATHGLADACLHDGSRVAGGTEHLVLEAGAVRKARAGGARPGPTLPKVLWRGTGRGNLHDVTEKAPGHALCSMRLRAHSANDLPHQRGRKRWRRRVGRLVDAQKDADDRQHPEEVIQRGARAAEAGRQRPWLRPRLLEPGAHHADLGALRRPLLGAPSQNKVCSPEIIPARNTSVDTCQPRQIGGLQTGTDVEALTSEQQPGQKPQLLRRQGRRKQRGGGGRGRNTRPEAVICIDPHHHRQNPKPCQLCGFGWATGPRGTVRG